MNHSLPVFFFNVNHSHHFCYILWITHRMYVSKCESIPVLQNVNHYFLSGHVNHSLSPCYILWINHFLSVMKCESLTYKMWITRLNSRLLQIVNHSIYDGYKMWINHFFSVTKYESLNSCLLQNVNHLFPEIWITHSVCYKMWITHFLSVTKCESLTWCVL